MKVDEDFENIKVRTPNSSKFRKELDFPDRAGRLHRAEKKYRKTKTHIGKGKTLRTHRILNHES